MGIAEDEVAARFARSIGAHVRQQVGPVAILGIVATHQVELAEVNGFDTGVYVGRGQEVEPHFGFDAGDIGNRRAAAPVVGEALVLGGEHFGIIEIARLGRLGKFLKDPGGNGYCADALLRHNLKDGGLQDNVGVVAVNARGHFPALRQELGTGNAGFVAPEVESAAEEFGAGIAHHADIVIEVAGGAIQFSESDGAGEIIFEDLAGDFPIEVVVAFSEQALQTTGHEQREQANAHSSALEIHAFRVLSPETDVNLGGLL